MIRTIYLFALAAFLISGAQGQSLTQTIKGRIVDQQAKTPIIGATIMVFQSDPVQGGVTDVEGYFRISQVPIGRQTLVVSSVGYESKTLPNITVGSGKEVVLEIELTESLVEMEAVEIVANRHETGVPDNELATVSAISLSVEETSRYPATFGDPARAALTQAGVTTGGDDLLNEIVIRGNSPKGMLWRMEGVEIPNPNHFAEVGSSAGGISMLSQNVLGNSDFFTGAFPAQYGNATSGIFDLKMRKGNFDKYEHSFQAGLLGIAAASEGPMGPNTNASYLVNYRYSTLALFDKIGLNILGNQEDVTFQDLSFKIHLPSRTLGTFSLWGLGGLNTYTYTPNPRFGDDTDYEMYEQSMGATGLTHVVYLGSNTYLESIVSFTGSQSNNQEDSLHLLTYENEKVNTGATRFSTFVNHKFSARNMIRAGGIVSRLSYNLFNEVWARSEQRYYTVLDETGGTWFLQGFAQWQHRVTQDFTVNSGLHVTHFSLNGDTYAEPRLGFRYQMTSKGAFTGGFGVHNRMETLALYMAQAEQQDGTFIQPNKDLGFTRAIHAVVGYERVIRQDLRFKVETYYQYLFDAPVWPTDTVSDAGALSFSAINSYDGYTAFPLANKGTGENYGIEFTLEKFFTRSYYFLATASLYQSLYKGIDGIERNTRFNGNYIFNLVGGKEFNLGGSGNKQLNLNGKFIYAGGKREAPIDLAASREAGYTIRRLDLNYEEKLKDYMRFDVGISYKINRENSATVISADVQNVFGIENAYGKYYDPIRNEVFTAGQLGIFPNLSYKIEF